MHHPLCPSIDNPSNTRFSLNLLKIQRDSKPTPSVIPAGNPNDTLNPYYLQQQLHKNNSTTRSSSHMLPHSKQHRSFSQISTSLALNSNNSISQLKPNNNSTNKSNTSLNAPSINLQSLLNTPSLHPSRLLPARRARASSNLISNALYTSLKENIPLNSQRSQNNDTTTFEQDKKSVNSNNIQEARSLHPQPLLSARSTSHNNPSTSSQSSLGLHPGPSEKQTKLMLRKYSKQILLAKEELSQYNSFARKSKEHEKLSSALIGQSFNEILFEIKKIIEEQHSKQSQHHSQEHSSILNDFPITTKLEDELSSSSSKQISELCIQLLSSLDSLKSRTSKVSTFVKQHLTELNQLIHRSTTTHHTLTAMEIRAVETKIHRCFVNLIDTSGMPILLPEVAECMQELIEFSSRFQARVKGMETATTPTSQMNDIEIITQRADKQRRFMELEDTIEETKIENTLLKRQLSEREGAFKAIIEKLKKENKQILRENRQLQRENKDLNGENMNLREQLERQVADQSFNFYKDNNNDNTSNHNITNLSYFYQSINNHNTISAHKKTVADGGTFFNQSQLVLQHQDTTTLCQPANKSSFAQTFWGNIRTLIQDEDTTSILELVQKLSTLQSDLSASVNAVGKFPGCLFDVLPRDQLQEIDACLLYSEDPQHLQLAMSNYQSIFQSAFLSIFSQLMTETTKNATLQKEYLSLEQLLWIARSTFGEDDCSWGGSLVLLLSQSKLQYFPSETQQIDTKLFLSHLGGVLIGGLDLKCDDFSSEQQLTLEAYTQSILLMDKLPKEIKSKYLKQSGITFETQAAAFETLTDIPSLSQLALETQLLTSRFYVSIIDAASIITAIFHQKAIFASQQLRRISYLGKCESVSNQTEQVLNSLGISKSIFECWRNTIEISNITKNHRHQQSANNSLTTHSVNNNTNHSLSLAEIDIISSQFLHPHTITYLTSKVHDICAPKANK